MMIMKYLFFYIPIFYLYHSRQKNIKKFLSWCCVYLIPTCALAVIQSSCSLNAILFALLGVIMIYNFYEVGYIQNDTETIKKESSPSLRLTSAELIYYEKHKNLIYGLRLVIGIVLSCILMYTLSQPQVFLICVFSLLLIYQVYNRVRNRWNLFLHIFLISIRFCSLQLLFYPNINWVVLGCSFFLYPLPNILERAAFPKYHISMMRCLIAGKANIPSFRVKYYSLMLITAIILVLILPGFDMWLCVLFVYYLIIRIIFLLARPHNESQFIYFK